MKNFLMSDISRVFVSIVAVFLVASVSAAERVESVNVGGLLRIDSKEVNTVVNVPWVGFSADTTKPIDIASLVKTRNLVPGDMVMAVRPDGIYEAWTVSASRTWEPAMTVTKGIDGQTVIEAGEASAHMVERGVGLWLVRSGEGADVEKPFYVSGQYEAVAGNTTVVGGSAAAPTWTLLANPDRTVATDLNAIKWEGNPLSSDQISVITSDGGMVTYTWKSGKWGTGGGYAWDEEKGVWRQKARDENAIAPVGTAIWYIRKGKAFKFSWEVVKPSVQEEG